MSPLVEDREKQFIPTLLRSLGRGLCMARFRETVRLVEIYHQDHVLSLTCFPRLFLEVRRRDNTHQARRQLAKDTDAR